jgi:hypothetical protein
MSDTKLEELVRTSCLAREYQLVPNQDSASTEARALVRSSIRCTKAAARCRRRCPAYGVHKVETTMSTRPTSESGPISRLAGGIDANGLVPKDKLTLTVSTAGSRSAAKCHY